MKVRVCYTIAVDDLYRRAIRHFYGGEGLATREEVQSWNRQYGSSCVADILDDLKKKKGKG